MTKKKLIGYAEKHGWSFTGETDYRGFYKATRPNGHELIAVSLEAMKRLIDKVAEEEGK